MPNNSVNPSNVDEIKKEFLSFKDKAGNPRYIACFGKTFVDETDIDYLTSYDIGKLVLENNFAVLHGGYTGTMQAVSNGANEVIRQNINKNPFWNIGVPMRSFDGNVKRANCSQLTATENILDRKRILIDACDACIILPVGGMGTLLEAIEIFHVNQINSKFGGRIKPIIFYGKIWKELMNIIKSKLNLNEQSNGDDFTYYIDNLEQLDEILKKI